jgi:eukaryotic-like serine/threonine-protein kinase
MDEDQRPPSVDALVARGDYLGAARCAQAQGDLKRAIELLERIWRFADALPLALRLGDAPWAIRLALDAQDLQQARQIADGISLDLPEQLERAAATLSARGHDEIAARLLARAGRHAQAATLFQQAGQWLAAGEQWEKAHRPLEAGQVYERALNEGGSDRESAQAAHRMGRLLGTMGRHREAAAALQRAIPHPELRLPALRDLCAELLALGLPAAAEEIALRLHALMPEIPACANLVATSESSPLHRDDADAPAVPRRFRILRSLGAGSLGHVYAAQDELLGRTVAIKLLSVGTGTQGPERQAWERMLRESEAASRMHHPNIVAVYEMRPEEGLLVEEYLEGGTLAERVRREGPLPPAVVRRLALDLLAGLQEAHAQGIVHRDIKPANILFDSAGNAKLGDFGAAHLLDFGQTQTGGFIGTLAYISPEQISGSAIGPTVDLYALAATLFEALTGRPPFLGPDLVAQHLGTPPPSLGLLRPGLVPSFDETLGRALAKSPSQRFPSPHAMALAISAWPAVDVPAPARAATAATPSEEPVAPPVFLGRSLRGRVLLVHEPRVHRQVLREELDTPLTHEETARVRALAALGGPRVQRILGLTPDLRTITYEILPGQPTRLDGLPPEQRNLLSSLWPALAPLGFPPQPERAVVQTPAGPVVVLAPDYQAAKS